MPAAGVAITVQCEQNGAVCRSLDGRLVFTRLGGSLYGCSDGKFYRGGTSSGGVSVMFPVIDARYPPAPSPTVPSTPGAAAPASDLYGSGSGLHDWYLILLALVTLYVVMRVWPDWGQKLGWVVLVGAILSTEPAVAGFQGLVRSIQTGSIQ